MEDNRHQVHDWRREVMAVPARCWWEEKRELERTFCAAGARSVARVVHAERPGRVESRQSPANAYWRKVVPYTKLKIMKVSHLFSRSKRLRRTRI